MPRTKLIWQLFPSHILILLTAILAVSWFGSQAFRNFYLEHLTADLEARSRLMEPLVRYHMLRKDFSSLQTFCLGTGRKASTRITVIEPDGRVVCDSMQEPGMMENHAGRPEFADALNGLVGSSIRYSATTRQDMVYVAIPIIQDHEILGGLRSSLPVETINSALGRFVSRTAISIVLVIIAAATIALFLAGKISRPLEIMRQGARRFADGDFAARISVSGAEEIVQLAQTMNRMAAQLDDRIRTAVNQRNELETVVGSMVEGVLAVDRESKVVYMNGSAGRQLGIEPSDVRRKNIPEVVRNRELLGFIQDTLQRDKPVEDTIIINRGRKDKRILQVHGAQLMDIRQGQIGALIVINDVTQLLRLENMRRDFVANVSHELKTPITSIKGYVETLLAETEESPSHIRDFLEIINKHANRLQAIVEDLLTLSRIEQRDEREEITLERRQIKTILHDAIEACSAKAAEKNIAVTLHCPDNLEARINGPLIEQAVINLLDNAVNYSEPANAVYLAAETDGQTIRISVRDNGTGIDKKHLPRLFERFYIVDKARSRKLGGTGLGLAIVKHIVQAHNGEIAVTSESGKGSTFTMKIPTG